MKHYRFTAEECIGWLRIARPGSVIGPQQYFIKEMQSKMWKDGDLLRATLKGVLSSSSSPSIGNINCSNDNSVVNGSMNKLNQAGTTMSLHQNMKNLSVSSSSSSPYSHNNNSHHNTTPNNSSSSNNSAMMMMSQQDSNIRIPTPSSSARLTTPSSNYNYNSNSGGSGSSNVNSADRQREERGETTQGDLLRQRRAQAMHHSPTSPTGSGGGSGNKVSPTSPTTSPPSSRTFTSFLSSWTK